MDCLDLLAVQGTVKTLLQHHNSKASVLRGSAFFIVQLLHWYMNTGKTIDLTRGIFVGKVISLLFNMLSRLVITFFSKEQVSSNFMAEVTICSDFGVPKNKVSHCFTVSPSICREIMDQMPWSQFSECWALSQLSQSPLSTSSITSYFFTFCHKGGVICISEVIDTSPGNLDSSLCFFQPSVSHDVLYSA